MSDSSSSANTFQPAAAGFASTGPAMGQAALLAKKMAKGVNPKMVSPTDNLMTPCSAKLNQSKKKHFAKAGFKPLSFGTTAESDEDAGKNESK
ncbi:hypothetical protein BOTBODRAFT_30174 [Botryobasidium botryosum FD-172 SS1]|uniref:Spo12 family protein n=1 Tax=Botryobasidium botryosum (strain FD-172 SS1) TaxID=930990 RepID=A0A067MRP5_BOTB1|nr:hypothetical protein BOTBODRAFT_30174 [Botryobasidium botryosum FD-172 SS1]